MSGSEHSERESPAHVGTPRRDTPDGAHPVAARVARAGLHGVVSVFDGNQEDWVEYAERLENYFIANDIEDEAKRRAILLNGVGASTYRLIKTLALPGRPKDLTVEEIVKRVKVHFNPKPSPIIKRFEFNTRCQKEGEKVATFVAALRKIAEHCEYGDVLNDMLRDRIVCGILNKRVQRRLLQEVDLTYAKALDIAQAAETADTDSKRLQDHKETSTKDVTDTQEERKPINRVHNPPKKSQQPAQQKSECYRCGGKHPPARCKYKDFDCHFCKKKGHLASVCRKKKKEKGEPSKEQANRVADEGPSSSEDDSEPEYRMYHIGNGSTKPLVVNVCLNGKDLEMELDTGASVSLMSEEKFRHIQGDN